MNKIEVKIKDKETGDVSEPVDIEEFILDPYGIVFAFARGDMVETLPYKDFQDNISDFQVIVTVHEKELKNEKVQDNQE